MFLILVMCTMRMCLCADMRVWAQVPADVRRVCQVSWRWRVEQLYAAWCAFQEKNSGLLQERCMLLTTERLSWPPPGVFLLDFAFLSGSLVTRVRAGFSIFSFLRCSFRSHFCASSSHLQTVAQFVSYSFTHQLYLWAKLSLGLPDASVVISWIIRGRQGMKRMAPRTEAQAGQSQSLPFLFFSQKVSSYAQFNFQVPWGGRTCQSSLS